MRQGVREQLENYCAPDVVFDTGRGLSRSNLDNGAILLAQIYVHDAMVVMINALQAR